MTVESRQRWPRFVYGTGEEPDYRFSFANERTYLAWMRTALALMAAGVALDVVDLAASPGVQRFAAIVLVGLGLAATVAAWVRWALAERAMRGRRPLPSFGFAAVITLSLLLIGIAAVIILSR